MTNWNQMGKFVDCYNPAESNTEYRVQLTPNPSAHTKGSYSEIVSSLPYDISGIIASSVAEYYGAHRFFWDIAIGAASSESVIVSNLGHQVQASQWFMGINHFIPISIKSGTRVSARVQSTYNAVGQWLKVGVHFLRKEFSRNYQISDTYGAVTASTIGTAIDPGATANTKGSWVELTSGLTRGINAFWLDIDNLHDWARTSCYWAFDIGIGSSGNEVAIVKDFLVSLWNSNDMPMPLNTPIFQIAISSGTRISARAKCTITTASDREFGLVLHTLS
jgi:hypothetical protein